MHLKRGAQQSQWKQWLATFAATSLMFSASFDTVWASRNDYPMSGFNRFANISSIMIGAIFGAVFADIFGRKRTLLAAAIFVIPRLASLNLISAESSWINKFFMDIGSGITCTVVPLYISEIADTNIRGILMVLQLTVFTFGFLFAETVHNVLRFYHVLQWMGIVHSAIVIISTSFHVIILAIFPETPHYLYWKKKYQEAGESLAFFRGVEHLEVKEEPSAVPITTQSNNERHLWRGKLYEIFQFDNRRNLTIILCLVAIKWASGQRMSEFCLMPLISKYTHGRYDYHFLVIWAAKLILTVCVMLTIDIFGRKLCLLLVTFVNFIAMTICLTPLVQYYWLAFVSFSFPIFGHVIFTAVTLAYVGTFFSVNVRATATAVVISFEVLTRDVIFEIEGILQSMLLVRFGISVVVLFFAFFLILIFFPNANKVPCSEITVESSEAAEHSCDDN